jgi:hypothetical protein
LCACCRAWAPMHDCMIAVPVHFLTDSILLAYSTAAVPTTKVLDHYYENMYGTIGVRWEGVHF